MNGFFLPKRSDGFHSVPLFLLGHHSAPIGSLFAYDLLFFFPNSLENHEVTVFAAPPCFWQYCVGCVPSMKTSCREDGHSGVASCNVSGSIATETIPRGGRKVSVLLYAGSTTARFMNSVQIGAAEDPPVKPKSWLSSKPTHTTHNKFDVYPANH